MRWHIILLYYSNMNSKSVYSASLKRMIGFKLFPNINPQQVIISQPNSNNSKQLTNFTESKKTDENISKMKKQISETRRKQKQFEKQIDRIVGKMVQDGSAQVVKNKIRRYGSSTRLRIVTQSSQNINNKYQIAQKNKIKYKILEHSKNVDLSKRNERDEENSHQKQKWKISLKIEQAQKSPLQPSLPRLRSQRTKTEIDLKKRFLDDQPPTQIYQAENAEKLIRHYRAGMSSLKKLKIRPIN